MKQPSATNNPATGVRDTACANNEQLSPVDTDSDEEGQSVNNGGKNYYSIVASYIRERVEDLDFEDEMAYTTPATFRGTSAENAETWFKHATWWLSTTRAGQGGDLRLSLHQIAVLFQEEAQNWFSKLRIGVQEGARSGHRN